MRNREAERLEQFQDYYSLEISSTATDWLQAFIPCDTSSRAVLEIAWRGSICRDGLLYNSG